MFNKRPANSIEWVNLTPLSTQFLNKAIKFLWPTVHKELEKRNFA